MEAIVYARHSTKEQRKGASRARQLADCRAYCSANDLTIVEELVDSGFSAWSNKHREKGALGRLEREILGGDHRGRMLVVEHLDRLSRLDSDDTFIFIKSIVAAGVAIHTINDAATYRADQNIPMLDIMRLLISSEQNHKQSEDKSRRVRDGKAKRREEARSTLRPMTRNAPPWLTLLPNRKWKVDKDRAAVIQEIFDWADGGLGKLSIARRLNERGEKPWSDAKGWHPSFILRLISNAAVIGECQPYETREGKRTPIGPPIIGYFPQIIDPALFARVNANAAARKAVRGRNSPTLNNLVSGIAYCAVCKGQMKFRVRKRIGDTKVVNGKTYFLKENDASLICDSYYRKSGCGNSRSIAYATFERLLLDEVLHLTLDDRAFSKDEDVRRLRTVIAELERARDRATSEAKEMWRSYRSKPSPMKEEMAEEAEAEATKLTDRLENARGELSRAQGKVSSAEHLARVSGVRATLKSDDPALRLQARAKVSEAFQSLISFIACDVDGSATVAVAGGLVGLRITGKLVERGDAIAAAMAGHVTAETLGLSVTAANVNDVVRRADVKAGDPLPTKDELHAMLKQRQWTAG